MDKSGLYWANITMDGKPVGGFCWAKLEFSEAVERAMSQMKRIRQNLYHSQPGAVFKMEVRSHHDPNWNWAEAELRST